MADLATTPHPEVGSGARVDYFRRLIEKQPAVLMRVAFDGTLLAANDAALGLLGADHLDQLADLTLLSCISAEHRNQWTAFASATARGTSNSFECDFTNLIGTSRRIVFHGIPWLDHDDGVPSTILSAHDMSTVRWSEAIFENREPSASPADASDGAGTPQGRLAELERLLRDGRHHLLDLRTKLERQTDDNQTLTAKLVERDASLQQSMDAHAALSEALSAREQQNADMSARLADHERAAGERATECERLLGLLDTRERELQTLADKHASLEAHFQSAVTERTRLEALLNDRLTELEAAKSARDCAATERDDLQARFETADRERRELAGRVEDTTTVSRRAEEALAKARLELDMVNAGTHRLLPLVSAGRLALEISGDLTAILAAIDARIAARLAAAPGSLPSEDLALLRADVFTAGLLAREILLSCDRPISASEADEPTR